MKEYCPSAILKATYVLCKGKLVMLLMVFEAIKCLPSLATSVQYVVNQYALNNAQVIAQAEATVSISL